MPISGACMADGSRWIQSRNCFVAIVGKAAALSGDDRDPAGVMQGLGQALLGWRPNFFQLLVSEIQNVLELEALATEDEHLRDPNTQAGLWLYLLESIADVDPHDASEVKSALGSIIGRIVDSMRRRLATAIKKKRGGPTQINCLDPSWLMAFL
jgi:hypothetical protein